MNKHLIVAISLLGLLSGCGSTSRIQESQDSASFETIAADRGGPEYKKGKAIVGHLLALDAESTKSFDVGMYRGERVAFVAYAAPPGGTNDLITKEGIYLRVINPKGRDLRPHTVAWQVFVCGEVKQVLPNNKIIIIQVSEEDWHFLQAS